MGRSRRTKIKFGGQDLKEHDNLLGREAAVLRDQGQDRNRRQLSPVVT